MPASAVCNVHKVIIAIVLIAIVWGAYSLSKPASTPVTTTNSAGSSAPDFTLQIVGPNGLSGQRVSLSTFRGRVVLLEFMTPECLHCQNMVPILEQLYTKYRGENVVFLSVSGQGSKVWCNPTRCCKLHTQV